MKENGYNVTIVPRNKFVLRQYQNHIDNNFILSEHLNHTPTNSLTELAEKYEIKSLRSFVFPEMVYDHNYPTRSYARHIAPTYGSPNYAPYIDELHRLIDYFDKLYSDGFDGIHISSQGAKIFRQVLQIVADYHGVQSIRYSFNPLPGRKSVRYSTKMSFPKLKDVMNSSLTRSEVERADRYIRNMKSQKAVYTPNTTSSSSKTDKTKNLINDIVAYREDLLNAVGRRISRPIIEHISGSIQSNLYSKQKDIDEIIDSKRYIFYPIQYSVESRLTLRAPQFYEQEKFVKYLSRNLPEKIDQLIVKDHPHHAGHLSVNAAYEIAQNSCFINPQISAHRIIQNSEAVITLNNTVGHEAIVWQKPVVTLGDALYNNIGITYDVGNINHISDIICEAISQRGPTQDEVRQYITGLFNISDNISWKDTEEGVKNTVSSVIERTK